MSRPLREWAGSHSRREGDREGQGENAGEWSGIYRFGVMRIPLPGRSLIGSLTRWSEFQLPQTSVTPTRRRSVHNFI